MPSIILESFNILLQVGAIVKAVLGTVTIADASNKSEAFLPPSLNLTSQLFPEQGSGQPSKMDPCWDTRAKLLSDGGQSGN